jgi:hypothetical protein
MAAIGLRSTRIENIEPDQIAALISGRRGKKKPRAKGHGAMKNVTPA